jgi:hypothetical protein
MSTVIQMKKKPIKYSKGYRLRPETHELISRIQRRLDTSSDSVLFNACREYYIKIKSKKSDKTK